LDSAEIEPETICTYQEVSGVLTNVGEDGKIEAKVNGEELVLSKGM
jgi:hypothetical protein